MRDLKPNTPLLRGIISMGLLALGAALPTGAPAATLRIVALSGDPVPGLPGVTLASLGAGLSSKATIDGAGRVVFGAQLAGAGVDASNDAAVILAEGDALSVLLREDDPAPGIPGGLVRIAGADHWVQNDDGDLALRVALSGAAVTAANDTAVLVERGGGLVLALREGDPVPGADPGVVLEDLRELRLDAAGRVALRSGITPSGSAIVRETASGLETAAITGAQPPGVEPGVEYGQLRDTSVNAAGQLAFAAVLTGVAGGSAADEAVFSEGLGPLAVLAREGSAVPGEPGELFGAIAGLGTRIDGSGLVALQDNQGYFLQRESGIEALARSGDPVPGLEAGAVFAFPTAGALELAADGTIAALTFIEGGSTTADNDRVLWREAGSGLEVVIRTGDIALIQAQFPAVIFTYFDTLFPAILDDGDLLAEARLRGSLVDSSNDESLWWFGTSGASELLLRDGDPIPVAPGDERALDGIPALLGLFDTSGQQGVGTGGPRSYNALGQVALAVGLEDGPEAVLVVPEPAAGAAGLGAALALAGLSAARRAGRPRT